MKTLIKQLYLNILSSSYPNNIEAVEDKAITNMMMYRTGDHPYRTQLNFNFVVNQVAYDKEKDVLKFIWRYGADE